MQSCLTSIEVKWGKEYTSKTMPEKATMTPAEKGTMKPRQRLKKEGGEE